MKNISIDARMINSSGIGTYLKNILPYLTKSFDTILLGNKEELLKFDWAQNTKIIAFNSSIYSVNEQLKFPSVVPKSSLLWCPHFNAPILPIRAKKIISTIHDVNHITLSDNFSVLRKNYAKVLYLNAIKRSKEIITVSQFSKSEIVHNFNIVDHKINVITNGVNTELFAKNTASRLSIELPENYILFVGSVKPHKNLLTLLKAYNLLDEQKKVNYRLVILGKKEGFNTADKKVKSFIKNNKLEDLVFFTGYLEDIEVPIVYRRAKLFVLPSLYEGFGLPVLEAMASSVPVISSNIESLKEVGGDAAVYFDSKSESDLKEKIEKLLNNKSIRDDYVTKGKKRIENFKWEKSAEKHIEIFNELMNCG